MKKLKTMIIFLLFILFQKPVHAEPNIYFVVNPKNPINEITIGELQDYYFKRKRRWADGTSVRFLDRSNDSSVRQVFLDTVLNKSSEEIDLYWIGQKLYTGDSAPLKESSDSMTIQFVSAFKGSIGYVSTPVTSDKIKILKVHD